MGVSAKPNTKSPIGYFGTGLKYAMAALVRLGTQPVVWIGLISYPLYLLNRESVRQITSA